MKKKLMVVLFVGILALSFAVPVMATENVTTVSVYETIEVGSENSLQTEMTQIVLRVCVDCGRLQFRVWSLTNGRWITDWLYV